MLIESMTREETFREIMRDLPLLKHWQRAKWKDELRSKFAHCPVFPAHAYRTWTSPNKNKWETYFYCVSKKQVFRPEVQRLQVLSWVRFNADNGRGAYSFSGFRTHSERMAVVKYIPHFFLRFHQRFIEPNHIDLMPFDGDLIRYFFFHNIDINIGAEPNGHVVYGTIPQGFIFGREEQNTFFTLKTYINYNILNHKKQEKLARILKLLNIWNSLPFEVQHSKPGSFKVATQLKG